MSRVILSKKAKKIKINRPVYFIGQSEDNLWVGTDFGVIKWHDGNQTNFTPHENLSGLETNRGAFYVDEIGNVWIGTDRGVSEYLSTQNKNKLIKPNIVVTYSGHDGKPLPLNKNVELEYTANDFIINVNIISFLNENLNAYKAKLENFDTDWLPEIKGNEKLRYTNLSPGRYILKIKGRNAFGIWSDEYISAEIIVLSPFYYRWWFILSVLTALIGIIYIISNYFSGRRYTARLKKTVEERTYAIERV